MLQKRIGYNFRRREKEQTLQRERETMRQTETQTEKRVFVLGSSCWFRTLIWVWWPQTLAPALTEINSCRRLYLFLTQRWLSCCLNINRIQTIMLTCFRADSLQGHRQTDPPLYPQPSIGLKSRAPSPGVCSWVVYDRAELECPAAGRSQTQRKELQVSVSAERQQTRQN